MADDDSSTLVVLLETHTHIWSSPQFCHPQNGPPTLLVGNFLEQVFAFLRCFLLVSESNKVAVFAVHNSSSPLLYASSSLQSGLGPSLHGQTFPSQLIRERLLKLNAEKSPADEGLALSGALSRALCYLQRVQGKANPAREQQRKARILCMQAAPDVSSQYISFMNAIFAAQRHDVVVDACIVGGSHSSLLQQACQLTGGLYSKPKRPSVLLEYLLAVYAGDTLSRSYLMLPHSQNVDFRASCFCHKKAIDLGFVCSVCLSIFCEPLHECSTCGTVFPVQQPGSKRKGQPLADAPSRDAR